MLFRSRGCARLWRRVANGLGRRCRRRRRLHHRSVGREGDTGGRGRRRRRSGRLGRGGSRRRGDRGRRDRFLGERHGRRSRHQQAKQPSLCVVSVYHSVGPTTQSLLWSQALRSVEWIAGRNEHELGFSRGLCALTRGSHAPISRSSPQLPGHGSHWRGGPNEWEARGTPGRLKLRFSVRGHAAFRVGAASAFQRRG